jgi:hypothetical protein
MCENRRCQPGLDHSPVADLTDILNLPGSPHKAVEQQPGCRSGVSQSGVMGKSGYMIMGTGRTSG